MKKYIIYIVLLFGIFSLSAQEKKYNIYRTIPLAQSIKEVGGNPFILNRESKIYYPKKDQNLKQIAVFLSEYIQIAEGFKIEISTESPKNNGIALQDNFKSDNKEAYNFTVNQNQILINGASSAGTFYGIQLLRKVLFENETKSQIELPAVEITDYPRFAYRGMHLDVARHFASVEFVKKYIDLLALHNINTFHWHLTDDQGWRVEIKKYPKLTQIGAFRTETQVGKQVGVYDGKPHGGFYTQEQIKEIVAYAQQRFITTIPEIDLPGHMVAALASYPELGCVGEGYEVYKKWGVSDDVLCIGNEKTFTFLEDVFTELIPLFPSKYLHIGGDECPKKAWEKCPKCQAKIAELGLEKDSQHSAEEKLQSYCMSRIEKFLNAKGKQVIGWDEILEGGIAPNATIMSWRSAQAGVDAVKQGHKAIMTPSSHVYFDYYQSTDAVSEPLAIGGFTNIERVYSFEPIPNGLTEAEKKLVIGAQANLWREYIDSDAQTEYMVLPRLAALSEVVWTNTDKKNYGDFLNRLSDFLKIYDKLNYNYAKHILEVSPEYKVDTENGQLILNLKTSSKSPIYYTVDGSEPTLKNKKYTESIIIRNSVTVKAAVISEQYMSKVFTKKFEFNKATAKPIVLKNEPIERYRFNGGKTLVDGRIGTIAFSTGDWIALYKDDFEATIDLKSVQEVKEVSMNTFTSPNDWIFGPKQFQVLVSKDRINFTPAHNEDLQIAQKGDGPKIINLKAVFATQNARYVKIKAPIFEQIPEWHYSAGQPTFLFVDEITIN
ncbi:glycoside hydrolase family 20 protein [Flavobacterium quisquiliarum]|uniref:beta-N-acetylhexosaminidase n=1 Tax=Flavobacterium quisquiliarum TaxID=1834436 RepID=A0ABV8W9R0_9FLAO|nr:family 20 glycosylhydrolase [Flavobacterium quisquiliarum]MBW1654104.1 family 20 glycosylhydrolase [Flavobacterium quisquiliarum]NWL03410.1 beta-N-acetylhexosaminidase [Flavobacterium collinsii]